VMTNVGAIGRINCDPGDRLATWDRVSGSDDRE